MYGIEDWEKYDHLGYICNDCESIKVNWTNGNVALCTPCYIKHVVEPNTEKITEVRKSEIDYTKRKVIAIEPVMDWLTVGKSYTVEDCAVHRVEILCDDNELRNIHKHRFRLLPDKREREKCSFCNREAVYNQKCGIGVKICQKCYDSLLNKNKISYEPIDKPVEKERCNKALDKITERINERADKVAAKTETTHSCTLEFPDGDVVEIPGPGDGWIGEETRYDWPHKHWFNLGSTIQTNLCFMNNENGKMIFEEFHMRIARENARIISITKWTRDPNWQQEHEADWKDEAVRRYPSRWR